MTESVRAPGCRQRGRRWPCCRPSPGSPARCRRPPWPATSAVNAAGSDPADRFAAATAAYVRFAATRGAGFNVVYAQARRISTIMSSPTLDGS